MFYNAFRVLLGLSPTWAKHVHVDLDDILVIDVWATAFGVGDREDDGFTASGLDLNKHPEFKGVALPMRGYGVRSLRNSPIPRMPFGINNHGASKPGAKVIIEDRLTGRASPVVPVIELGPSLYTGHAIDLSVGLAQVFDRTATANDFKRKVNYRIIDGVKYL